MRARRFVGCLFLVASCEVGALPSPSSVTGLRVLTLTADAPEVRPGGAPRVEAVTLFPSANSGDVVRWRLCAERDLSDPRDCPSSPRGVDLGLGGSVQLPALADLDADTNYVVLASACAGAIPTIDPSNGRALCGSSPSVEAFRRVIVRRAGALNANPRARRWTLSRLGETTEVTGDEVTLARCAMTSCGPWTVSVEPEAGSAEATPDGAESLVGSFYATRGSLDRPRDSASPGEVRALTARWTLPEGSEGARVAYVLRDLRGGDSARRATVRWR